jgi:hypothetical protein
VLLYRQNEIKGVYWMLRRTVVCRSAVLALSFLGMPAVWAQESQRQDVTGKWELKTQTEKGKVEVSTLDLTESGSSLIGTVTPLNGSAMTISDGYYVGAAIKISANGRQGLFSRSIDISGHIEGDKMILNVRRGNGTTYPAVAERIPLNPKR